MDRQDFMGTGILLCGLNGVGKSTLGRDLAEKTGFYFIDNEDLYFPKTDLKYLYDSPRSREEVEKRLFDEIKAHKNSIFAAVKGDYGEDFCALLRCAVLVCVPRELRLRRVKSRSFQKFGDRILPGGDLYEREKYFLDLVSSRPENLVEDWARSLRCPVIRVDGTKPIAENIAFILERM